MFGKRTIHYQGDIFTIGQAQSHFVVAICGNCEHWNDVSFDRLLQRHGPRYSLLEVFNHLKCRHCRRHATALVVDRSRSYKRRREPPPGGLVKIWRDDYGA